MDKNSKTFVVHVVSLNLSLILIYLDKETQIISLLNEEFKISDKYSDFVNIFSEEKALIPPEQTKLNGYAINLENSKQPLY